MSWWLTIRPKDIRLKIRVVMKLKQIKMNFLLILGFVVTAVANLFGQDTILLTQKPTVILKSWYPEYKDFPSLKIGEQKVLFTIIRDLEKTLLQHNDINLKAINAEVDIQETEKDNQYLVTLIKVDTSYVEFEVWLDLGDNTIMLLQNAVWKNIINCYPHKDNRIMIESIRLKTVK
jgi:hypothetical protein